MRNVALFAVVALLAPAAGRAQVALAGSAGIALPSGFAYEDARTGVQTEMSSEWASAYGLQLDVEYRFWNAASVGAYVSYAIARPGGMQQSVCDLPLVSCSSRTFRIGVAGSYRLDEIAKQLFPWFGVGFGGEWAGVDSSGLGASVETRFVGFELLGLRAGVEYQMSPRFAIGPYMGASLALYTSVRSDATGFPQAREPIRRTLHEWLSFGIRGRYEP